MPDEDYLVPPRKPYISWEGGEFAYAVKKNGRTVLVCVTPPKEYRLPPEPAGRKISVDQFARLDEKIDAIQPGATWQQVAAIAFVLFVAIFAVLAILA